MSAKKKNGKKKKTEIQKSFDFGSLVVEFDTESFQGFVETELIERATKMFNDEADDYCDTIVEQAMHQIGKGSPGFDKLVNTIAKIAYDKILTDLKKEARFTIEW